MERGFCDAAFSPREVEVLRLLALAMSSKDIAYSLSISVHTVNFHRKNISSKLGIHSCAELVKYAVQHFSN
jgi:DNA-binding CsgD family transcriptional regulator